MGLLMDYFYSLNPRQFNNICKGYTDKQNQTYKDNWEQARMGWFFSLKPHIKTEITPQDVMLFSWEKAQEKQTEIQPEEVKNVFKKFDKLKG